MAVTPGSKARAEEYNALAESVNLIFGDKYPSASVTDPDRTNHKFGWGGVNVDDALNIGTLITAERLQQLVDRTNVSNLHVNGTNTKLQFSIPAGRQTVDPRTIIRAEDLNVVENKFNTAIIADERYFTVASTQADNNDIFEAYKRNTPWSNKLTGEHSWSFNNYAHARHYFNSGGRVSISMDMYGGCTPGYYNWADVVNEIGLLTMTYNNFFQASTEYTQGVSEGKGFYDLTQYYGDGSDAGSANEGLLFTSSGVTVPNYGYGYGYSQTAYSGYGYGYCPPVYVGQDGFYPYPTSNYGYGYGYGYSSLSSYSDLRLKVYGKHANNGSEVRFKIVLDDTSFDQTVDGTIATSVRYVMPYSLIENSAEYDVSPDPVFSVIDNFNTGDDS
jgi:hypothetical protein